MLDRLTFKINLLSLLKLLKSKYRFEISIKLKSFFTNKYK